MITYQLRTSEQSDPIDFDDVLKLSKFLISHFQQNPECDHILIRHKDNTLNFEKKR